MASSDGPGQSRDRVLLFSSGFIESVLPADWTRYNIKLDRTGVPTPVRISRRAPPSDRGEAPIEVCPWISPWGDREYRVRNFRRSKSVFKRKKPRFRKAGFFGWWVYCFLPPSKGDRSVPSFGRSEGVDGGLVIRGRESTSGKKGIPILPYFAGVHLSGLDGLSNSKACRTRSGETPDGQLCLFFRSLF
jgi:hypothetical protein